MGEPVEVGRIRAGELSSLVAIWNDSFRRELSQRGADLGEIAPLFRRLLSFGRLPLRMLHRLGIPVDVWVIRAGGQVVGGVGQIGYRVPYIVGLVVRPDKRELRLVRILEGELAANLKRAGYSAMRAHVPYGHPIAKLGLKLGWEPVGETRQFVLPLRNLSPRLRTRSPKFLGLRRERALARRCEAAGDIRGLLSLERNYGGPLARLFGFREVLLVEGGKGNPLGVAGIAWNAFQPVSFMHVPLLRDEDAFEALLGAAVGLLTSRGKAELHVDLWEEQRRPAEYLRTVGAQEAGHWVYLIKEL